MTGSHSNPAVVEIGLKEIYDEVKATNLVVTDLKGKFEKLDRVDNTVQDHGRSIARINVVLGGYAILQTIMIAGIGAMVAKFINLI